MSETKGNKQDYPITDRNKVRRMRERGRYDTETIYKLLDSSLVCHIAYVVDGQPYCTPTLFWRRGNNVIWHGSVGSKMLKAQIEQEVCLTVSFFDSIVLTRGAFHLAVNYRSAMLFGRPAIIEDLAEKEQEAEELIENFLPGRSALAIPAEPHELRQATFVKMPIDQAVAKIRDYPASHEIAENRQHPIWAGEIPIETRIGSAVPCTMLDPAIDPSPDLAWYRQGAPLDATLLEIRRRTRGPKA